MRADYKGIKIEITADKNAWADEATVVEIITSKYITEALSKEWRFLQKKGK